VGTGPVRIVGMPLTTTMAVLRLPDERLLLYSPVAMTPERRAAVDALGSVAHLYAPNLMHHRWIGERAAAYPSARLHAPSALARKRPDLRIARLPGETPEPAFAGVIDELHIDGFRLDETALSTARRTEETVLYRLLAEHWRSFPAATEAEDGSGPGLPSFVVDEVESLLECGILAHGFIRVACDGCSETRLVTFSCKRRGFCPSCLGRRMADFAAHLCDHVMPHVPVRQWVLTVPFGLRFGMAFDPALAGVVLRTFVAVVSRWLRRRARAHGIRGILKTGGVTVIQRFGSALLNVAIADARDARDVLSAKNLNPRVQRQITTIEALLKTAKTTADQNRPAIMSRVVSLIDSASAALFTRTSQ